MSNNNNIIYLIKYEYCNNISDKLKQCNKYKVCYYCDNIRQKNDWLIHKKICTNLNYNITQFYNIYVLRFMIHFY
jgi:hypothetical protein